MIEWLNMQSIKCKKIELKITLYQNNNPKHKDNLQLRKLRKVAKIFKMLKPKIGTYFLLSNYW